MSSDGAFDDYIEYELEISSNASAPVRVLQDPTGASRTGVGSTVWDAALVMAKYLDHQVSRGTLDLAGKLVVELGAGTGLVGLALARMQPGCRVVLTDKKELVPLLRRNIAFNHAETNVQAQELDWTDDAALESLGREVPDLVLVSDGVWAEELHKPLADTLRKLTDRSTRVLLAFESRNFAAEARFMALWGERFRFRDIKPADQHPVMQSEDIFLFDGQRKDIAS
ncbi:Protein-lysine N-methyltransferase efm6 [Coemansia sp. Benny D115]|nr:Protein-lysine N-methyltransferase efm6 [Coemansia sp. Benny D115]